MCAHSKGGFRELQRWQPEPGSAPDEHLEAGSDAYSRKGGRHGGVTGWDQFAVNQAKFKACCVVLTAWSRLCAVHCTA